MNMLNQIETWPGKGEWMKRKPLGMQSLKGRTSERLYTRKTLYRMIIDNLSPDGEASISKNLPIDILHDFKIHFKGMFRIRYRGKSDYSKRYFRNGFHCVQEHATSFAIYPVDVSTLSISEEE